MAQVDEALAEIAWQWTSHLIGSAYTEDDAATIVKLLTEAADVMQRQSDPVGATALRVVAERYQTLPQRIHLSAPQLEILLNVAWRYLEIVKPLSLGQDGYVYLHHCLE